jgi:DNA invertase Pin-like site-specific DNA recombinase
MAVRAIAYIRVSGLRQLRGGSSLESQQALVDTYAADKGYEVVELFIERAESAKTDERSELTRLRQYCRENAHRIDVLIFPKIDRFSRYVDDYTSLRRELRNLGIKFDSIGEQFSDTPSGRFHEHVLAAAAQFDNEIRAERSMNGTIDAVKAGRYVWPPPPGFERVRHEGKGTIAPSKDALVVQQVFEALASRRLTPKEAVLFATSQGVKISKSSLNRMVHSKLYIGIIEMFGMAVESRPPFVAIVDVDTFYNAQKAFRARKQPNIPYDRDNEAFPLRGTLRCESGHVLTAAWAKGKLKKYPYFRCMTCKRINFRADTLTNSFGVLLARAKPDPEKVRGLKHKLERDALATFEVESKARHTLTADLAAKKELQTALALKCAAGIIPDQIAKEQSEKLEREMAELRTELSRITAVVPNPALLVDFAEAFFEHLPELWNDAPMRLKKQLQRFFFPDGLIAISPNDFRTPGNSVLEVISQVLGNGFACLAESAPESTNTALTYILDLQKLVKQNGADDVKSSPNCPQITAGPASAQTGRHED